MTASRSVGSAAATGVGAERSAADAGRGAAREGAAGGLHPAAFSVDLEDYFHPELVRRHVAVKPATGRVADSTAPILDLLDRHRVRATFFIVGEVIETDPALVRRIVAAGHEIGCHTHTHRPLWELEPESFRDELRRFKSALRSAAGEVEVRGFRAPTFSLDGRTSWALRVLEEEGFTYDSSIFPCRGPLYGCPGAPLGLYRPAAGDFLRHDPGAHLVEFPAPLSCIAGARLPVGGGIYLRTMPLRPYLALVRRVLRERPFFLYLHPWETDPGIPRVKLPLLPRLATYTGIRGVLAKVEGLLRSLRFTTMRSALEQSGFGV